MERALGLVERGANARADEQVVAAREEIDAQPAPIRNAR
jgi:hypothetical protein